MPAPPSMVSRMENVLLDAVDDPSLPEIASGPAPPVTLSELVVSGLISNLHK